MPIYKIYKVTSNKYVLYRLQEIVQSYTTCRINYNIKNSYKEKLTTHPSVVISLGIK